MSTYREVTIAAKAARRGITEQRPVRVRSKKARPWRVRARCVGLMGRCNRRWYTQGTYRTEVEAKVAVAGWERKHPGLWEFKVEGPK